MNDLRAPQEVVELSHEYGAGVEWVIAGGGNSSLKEGGWMWIKPSGVSMETVDAEAFVRMDCSRLEAIWGQEFPEGWEERERVAKQGLLDACAPGEGGKRPSSESLMHALFPQRIVFHTHPALVNGITCSQGGERAARAIFGDSLLWIPIVNPGYLLAKHIRDRLESYRAQRAGRFPALVLLQNHGLVVYGERPEMIRSAHRRIVAALSMLPSPESGGTPESGEASPELREAERRAVVALAPHGYRHTVADGRVGSVLSDRASFAPLDGALTPDHIVYMGHRPLWVESVAGIEEEITRYCQSEQAPPKLIALRRRGIVALGKSAATAHYAQLMFHNACQIAGWAAHFGGVRNMPREQVEFIRNWEVEAYRKRVAVD